VRRPWQETTGVAVPRRQSLVAKVWHFVNGLRDQGLSYQAYISQISYLLFFKTDEECVNQIGEALMLPEALDEAPA
jgi:hypothetical protein